MDLPDWYTPLDLLHDVAGEFGTTGRSVATDGKDAVVAAAAATEEAAKAAAVFYLVAGVGGLALLGVAVQTGAAAEAGKLVGKALADVGKML